MVKKIIWNDSALRTFDNITSYLQDNYSLQAAYNFSELAYNKIDQITKYPTIGRPVPNTKTLQKINFGKHHQLYFRLKGRTLYICDFFDTRQDPTKRPY